MCVQTSQACWWTGADLLWWPWALQEFHADAADDIIARGDALIPGRETSPSDIGYDDEDEDEDGADYDEGRFEVASLVATPEELPPTSGTARENVNPTVSRQSFCSPHDWLALTFGACVLFLEGHEKFCASRHKHERPRKITEPRRKIPSLQDALGSFQSFLLGQAAMFGDSGSECSDSEGEEEPQLVTDDGFPAPGNSPRQSSRAGVEDAEDSMYPRVGDAVMAEYHGDHHDFRGQRCLGVVVADNGDGSVTLQWRDGDTSGRIVDVSMLTKEPRGRITQNASKSQLTGILMKRALPENSLRVASAVVSDGADLIQKDVNTTHTPLTMAVACAVDIDLLRLLVDGGSDVNASGPAGTAVQMIARLADTDALYFLLSRLAHTDGISLNECTQPVRQIVEAYRSLGITEMRREVEKVVSAKISKQSANNDKPSKSSSVKDSKGDGKAVSQATSKSRAGTDASPISQESPQAESIAQSLQPEQVKAFADAMLSNILKILNAISPNKPRNRRVVRRMLMMLAYLITHYPIDMLVDDVERIEIFAPAIRLLPRFIASQYLDIVKLSLDAATSILNISMHNYYACEANGLKVLAKRVSATAEYLVKDRCTSRSCQLSAKELLSRFSMTLRKWTIKNRKQTAGNRAKRK